MKRLFDILASGFGLLVFSPVLVVCCYLIWRKDGHSPFYIANRVGKDGKAFRMVKLRSMIKNADQTGVNSTSASDNRITKVGHFIRRYKVDEISQLWNVFKGDMSLVGPRPNVQADVNLYTEQELGLLTVRPGITDFSSIVFSDEGDILKGSDNPDLKYNQVIRPWKSRLGLIYIQNKSLLLDIKLILITVVAIISKQRALRYTKSILAGLQVDDKMLEVVMRDRELVPYPPPGSDSIVTSI